MTKSVFPGLELSVLLGNLIGDDLGLGLSQLGLEPLHLGVGFLDLGK